MSAGLGSVTALRVRVRNPISRPGPCSIGRSPPAAGPDPERTLGPLELDLEGRRAPSLLAGGLGGNHAFDAAAPGPRRSKKQLMALDGARQEPRFGRMARAPRCSRSPCRPSCSPWLRNTPPKAAAHFGTQAASFPRSARTHSCPMRPICARTRPNEIMDPPASWVEEDCNERR